MVTLEPLFQDFPELAVDSREEDTGFVKFFGRLEKKVSLWGKLFVRERKRLLNHAVS